MSTSTKPTKRFYRDKEMARSKGLIGRKKTMLPRCAGNCKECIACIRVTEEGDREHMNPKR